MKPFGDHVVDLPDGLLHSVDAASAASAGLGRSEDSLHEGGVFGEKNSRWKREVVVL